jgi:hypothetical protein
MSIRRAVSTLLLAVYLPACTAYHRSDEAITLVAAVPGAVSPIRVTTLDGQRTEVWSPTIATDTLFGSNGAPGEATGRVAVPLSVIRSTAVRKPDPLRTVGVVALAIGGAVALVAVVTQIFGGAAQEIYQ